MVLIEMYFGRFTIQPTELETTTFGMDKSIPYGHIVTFPHSTKRASPFTPLSEGLPYYTKILAPLGETLVKTMEIPEGNGKLLTLSL